MAGLADYINAGANLAPNAFGELGPRLSAGDYTGAAGAALRGVAASPISAGSDIVNAATAAVPAVTHGLASFGRALLGQSSPPPVQPVPVTPAQAPSQQSQALPVIPAFSGFGDYSKIRGTPVAQAPAAAQSNMSPMAAGPGVSFAPGVAARAPAPGPLTFQQALALHTMAKPPMTPVEQAQNTLARTAMEQHAFDMASGVHPNIAGQRLKQNLLSFMPGMGANYQLYQQGLGVSGYPGVP